MAKRLKIGRAVGATLMLGVSLYLVGCASSPHRRLRNLAGVEKQAAQAYEQGEYPAALSGYRQLADQLPDDASVWFRLGNVYAHLNQPQMADKAYLHVLQRNPHHARAWHNLAVMYLHQAEAAFVQSAQSAGTRRPDLRKQGLDMASRLNALAGKKHPDEDHEPPSTVISGSTGHSGNKEAEGGGS